MAGRQRIVCQCGAPLRRPLPRRCPRCGAEIVAWRRSYWSLWRAVLIVAALFATLIAYLVWLVGRG